MPSTELTLTPDQLVRNCAALREERDRARWQRHKLLYALEQLRDDPAADGGTRALANDAILEARKVVCREDEFVAAVVAAVTGGETLPSLWRLTWVDALLADVRAGYHAHDDPGALQQALSEVQLLRDGLAAALRLLPEMDPEGVPPAAKADETIPY